MARSGNNHRGGRPTKAEEMGLEKRMNDAFKAVTKNKDHDGATQVIQEMFKIAMSEDHAKKFDALKWLTDRYFGKEPKAIIQEIDIKHELDRGTIKDFFGGSFDED